MDFSRTVVISCAGMGNRLGLGTTKALVEIEGKPLIGWHLENLSGEVDIRVVVGYQAQQVIDVVNQYRNDVTFVFNYNYQTTKTGDSVVLAAQHSNEYILSLDGDLLIHPDDMQKILACENEFVSGGEIVSDDPWFVQVNEQDGRENAVSFSRDNGKYEWNGITQIRSHKILHGKGHVFQLVEPYMPFEFLPVRTREIDTLDDFKRAVIWVKNGFK